MLRKHIIYKTQKEIWIVPIENWSKEIYERELKITEILLCECSLQFIERIQQASSKEIVQCLLSELQQDKRTSYSN